MIILEDDLIPAEVGARTIQSLSRCEAVNIRGRYHKSIAKPAATYWRRSILGLIVVVELICQSLLSSAKAQSSYSLTDLGTLNGYRLSTGTAINIKGEAVGLCFNGPGDTLARAFLYRQGLLIDLGAQIDPRTRTQAASINVRTQIVGLVYESGSSLFSAGGAPARVTENDPKAVELGVKFQSSVPGTITAIRFYKGPRNSGTHVGNLWRQDSLKPKS